MNLCLQPHSDDAVLFCAFTAQRLNARVVTVLESHVQEARGYGITQQQRRAEDCAAVRELGLTVEQWPFRDDRPDWPAVEASMRAIDDRLQPETVLAPLVELGGHEHHNAIGNLADTVFGSRLIPYCTYVRGQSKTTGEIAPFTTDQVVRKLRALACYRSQIGEPTCAPWFFEGLTEYLA